MAIPWFEPESGFSDKQKQENLLEYQSFFRNSSLTKTFFALTLFFTTFLGLTFVFILKTLLPLIFPVFVLFACSFLWLVNQPFLIKMERSVRETGSLFSGWFRTNSNDTEKGKTYKSLRDLMLLALIAALLFFFASSFSLAGLAEINLPKDLRDVSSGWRNIKLAAFLYFICGIISLLLFIKMRQVHD